VGEDKIYEMSSSKYVCASLLVVAISLSVFVTLSVLDQAYAAKYPYKGQLSGKNEVPPVQTKATGEAEFTKVANATMKYRVNVTGISNATGAHIHMAKTGANGEIIADLLNTPTSKDKDTAYGMIIRGNISASSLKGPMQGKTLDDLAAAMESGNAYVNVHTTAHKNGEIRGQLSLEGGQQKAPTNSTNSTVGFSTLTE
jgi:hypothetical protein